MDIKNKTVIMEVNKNRRKERVGEKVIIVCLIIVELDKDLGMNLGRRIAS